MQQGLRKVVSRIAGFRLMVLSEYKTTSTNTGSDTNTTAITSTHLTTTTILLMSRIQ